MTRLLSILFVILLAASAFADLTLTWDAPTNAAECGTLTYRLYASTNGGAAFFVVTNTPLLTVATTNRFGTTIYAVTALNASGDESDRSDTLTVQRIKPQKPTITKYTITTQP